MIDIHAHVIPGLDDGAADLAEAQALIAEYGRQGVTDIICTSHLLPQQILSDDGSYLQRYYDAFTSLRVQFATCERPVRLHRGYELVLMPDLARCLHKFDKQDHPLTLAGSAYLLVELPRWLSGGIGSLEQLLFGLQLMGFTPILAHPERIVDLASVLPMLYRWIEQERVLLQLNTSAIVAPRDEKSDQYDRFKRRQPSVDQMIRAGMVHFMASDAHNLQTRPPQNQAAWAQLTATYGESVARQLLLENPAAILADRPVTARLKNLVH
ncbi:MAG: CpsB/CapC family capsule biosynthesis tyrosine phosphatase [Bacillota bacterium]|nr:CpsB/CapC family capsule biosynthesis tyrosine phosphatase [Bacillota bacterium]